MIRMIASVGPLLISVGLMQIANGLFGSLLGVRLGQDEAISSEVSGLVLSGYFMGMTVGCLVCGRIIDRVGHVRTFAVLISIVSAVSVGHAYLVDPVFWWVLRVVYGFCMAGAYMVAESWLNGAVDNRSRGTLLSIYMIVQFGAMSGSQYLLNLASAETFILFGLTSIVFSLSLVPLSLQKPGSSGGGEVASSALSFRELYHISPLGMVCSFGSGIMMGAILAGGPIFGSAIGLSVSMIAQFISVMIFGGLLMQYPLGKLSDLMDRRTVMTGALFVGTVAAVVLALVPLPFWLFLTIAGLHGGIASTLYSISVAHTNDYLDPSDLVPASAGLLLAFGIGAAAGPIVATQVMGLVGNWGFYGFSGLVSLAVGGFALWRMASRPPVPMEEQGPFVFVSRASPVGAELDPRAEPSDEAIDDHDGDADPVPGSEQDDAKAVGTSPGAAPA
jgi:MFS family permease